jgi:hypothetical protein
LAAVTNAPVIPLRISGVAAQGHVVSAVVARGQAVVERLPVIDPQKICADELYQAIEDALSTQVEA